MTADDAGRGRGPDDDPGARRQRLYALLAGADSSGSPDGPTGAAGRPYGDRVRLGHVCGLAVSEVGVSGAGITVMTGLAGALAGDRDQVWATCALTRRLEGLQLTTGDGPCLDAFADGTPMLVADLSVEVGRWIGFGPDALSAGAAAVFSFPLQVGAVRLGTLDLHRDTAGELSRDQLADASTLATVATEILLDLTAEGERWARDADDSAGRGEDTYGWLPGVHAEVHQASGMVSGRERIGLDAALLRIRGHAYSHGEPIDHVARRILDRTLTLDEHRADEPDVVPDEYPNDGLTGPDVETDR